MLEDIKMEPLAQDVKDYLATRIKTHEQLMAAAHKRRAIMEELVHLAKVNEARTILAYLLARFISYETGEQYCDEGTKDGQ